MKLRIIQAIPYKVTLGVFFITTLSGCNSDRSDRDWVDVRQYFYSTAQLKDPKVFCYISDDQKTRRYELRKLQIERQDTFILISYYDNQQHYTNGEAIKIETNCYKTYYSERVLMPGMAESPRVKLNHQDIIPFFPYLDVEEAYKKVYTSENSQITGIETGFFTKEEDSIALRTYSKTDCLKLSCRAYETISGMIPQTKLRNNQISSIYYFKNGFGCIYYSKSLNKGPAEVFRLEKIISESEFDEIRE